MLPKSIFRIRKKKVVISELLRIVETENSKRKKKTTKEVKALKVKKKQVEEEVAKKVEVIREKKKVEKKKAIVKEKLKPKYVFKIGDRVRLLDGKAVGSIDSLEKKKAIVNYGLFTTNVDVEKLELVQAKK